MLDEEKGDLDYTNLPEISVVDDEKYSNTPDSSSHLISNNDNNIEETNYVNQTTTPRLKPLDNSKLLINQTVLYQYLRTIYMIISFISSEWKKGVMILFISKTTWDYGVFYLCVGLFLGFIQELCSNGPKYNVSILIASMAAISFSKFPPNSVRIPLLIAVAICLSVVIDIRHFALPNDVVSVFSKSLTSMIILSKVLVLQDIMWYSDKTSRARKYLARWWCAY